MPGEGDDMRRGRVISLFTGAGGLDYGLEAAGFDTAVALEFDDDCVSTLTSNRPWPVIHRDVHEVSSQEILDTAGLVAGEADALVGGPPCQPFSKSGYWATGDSRRLDDPRSSTLDAYLRVLRDTLPRAFLLENVAGLAYRSKDEAIRHVQATIREINKQTGANYQVRSALLNAAEFGVPQIRERFFLVGMRDGLEYSFPRATHGEIAAESSGLLVDSRLEPFRTAWDALGDLANPLDSSLRVTGKWAALLPSIPEGENYLFHTERGGGLALFGWRRRYWSFLLKLSKRLPSWTITAQPGSAIGPFHWTSRRLSTEELCRLQTFPANLKIVGSRGSVQKQLGNAVPSALAEALGNSIAATLGLGHCATELSLIPPRRLDMPDPEPVLPVPARYRHLAGDHDAHPGTGRGYSAVRRAAV